MRLLSWQRLCCADSMSILETERALNTIKTLIIFDGIELITGLRC